MGFSTQVLHKLLNGSVSFDTGELLEKAKDYTQAFVPTALYAQCVAALEESRIVCIQGNPGTGKSSHFGDGGPGFHPQRIPAVLQFG